MTDRATAESLYRDIVRQRLTEAVAAVERLLAAPPLEMEVANTRGAVQSLDRALFDGFVFESAAFRGRDQLSTSSPKPKTPRSIEDLI